MKDSKNLIEILQYRAALSPEKIAFTFLHEKEGEEKHLTYHALDQRARAVAARLQELNMQGERALLLYPPGLDYITALFGCFYAGVIAVPAYPPKKNRSVLRVEKIALDAQAKIALTGLGIKIETIQEFSEHTKAADLLVLETPLIPDADAPNWKYKHIGSGSLAFLQYTSGSTGYPKGVMVSHANLLHNLQVIQKAFQIHDESVGCGWLPPYHDMGLIGNILGPVYCGIPNILMSPLSFLQKPQRWLQTISRYRVSLSGGPNFAYDLCARKITDEQLAQLDLGCWQLAYNGAEPVQEQTLRNFADKFTQCGFRKQAFYPCYGLAEGTLFVTGGEKNSCYAEKAVDRKLLLNNQVVPANEDADRTAPFVGCGVPLLGQKVCIVHPEKQTEVVSGEEVGEIWVRGSSVAKGYWNNPELTNEVFHAFLAGSAEGPFLRTGDLGFISQGELYVTGRKKDLIIIRGQNHYPQDIEHTVETSHGALRKGCVAVFSLNKSQDEQLVVVAEIDRQAVKNADFSAICLAIHKMVAECHELDVAAVALIQTGSIPKTSSGKIQRYACRNGFEEGTLELIHEWRRFAGSPQMDPEKGKAPSPAPHTAHVTYASVEKWLRGSIAEHLKTDPASIDVHEPFVHHGLDSMAAVQLSVALGEWLGKEIPPTIVYDYPNIAVLAQYLSEKKEPATVKAAPTTRPANNAGDYEPIAVVGIGCRFPMSPDPQSFWELLKNGKDAVRPLGNERWKLFKKDIPPHLSFIQSGGFLDRIDGFDASFFGVSAREAVKMDPQQRLLLEVAWETFEHAGMAPEELADQQVGIFVGISSNDYSRMQLDPSLLDAYNSTGNAASIAANRLSYFFNFHGPSMSLDTACSSSLVVVHQACRSLQNGECTLSLAAGVNLMVTPDLSLVFARAGMLSPHGVCRTFDADADGYVRGEGCGAVLLKRLQDAVRDGDTIYSIIRGSAMNQDGRTNGLTAPNGRAQEAVLRAAFHAASIRPGKVDFVEAHGTGTSLGDPIEINALTKVLSEERAADHPCYIGAVKTNIGHLEAAAGIAGLIKAVLTLHHGYIVPNLHFRKQNTAIRTEDRLFRFPATLMPLLKTDNRAIAGVSSFGFGGTNVHVVLESAGLTPSPLSSKGPELIVLSAAGKDVLSLAVQRLLTLLRQTPQPSLRDVAATLLVGRNHMQHRLAFVTADHAELEQKLEKYLQADKAIINNEPEKRRPVHKTAFLFTGQGCQYPAMARELYETEEAFRNTLNYCSSYLQPLINISLVDLLYTQPDNSRIHQTGITQPLLFAIEVSMAKLWQYRGVEPAAVMGHSVGEIAAACVAGIFSLDDGLKLVAIRGSLMQALPQGGEMWALSAAAQQVEPVIKNYSDTISVAGLNAPHQTVIAGAAGQLEEVIPVLLGMGIRAVKLAVSHAFHSPLMAPVAAPFKEKINGIRFHEPVLPVVSNVTGSWAGTEMSNPGYWVNHVLAPVRFCESVQLLQREGFDTFLEMGPDAVLINLLRQSMENDPEILALPSITRHSGNREVLFKSLGALYTRGTNLSGKHIYPAHTFRKLALPAYPFKQERFWLPEQETPMYGASLTDQHNTSANGKEYLQENYSFPGKKAGSQQEKQELPPYASLGEKEDSSGAPVYEKIWVEQDITARDRANEREVVVVVAEDPLVIKTFQDLQKENTQITVLCPKQENIFPAAEKPGHPVIQMNDLSLHAYQTALQQLLVRKDARYVFVFADGFRRPEGAAEGVFDFLQKACSNLLHLLQALTGVSLQYPCSLVLLTPAHSIHAPGAGNACAAACLAAIARSAQLEMPELRIRTIEVDTPSAELLEAIYKTELTEASFAEPESAYFNQKRYVSRLQQYEHRQDRGSSSLFSSAELYLITGGTGAIGQALVLWMISQGARHFILTTRRQVPGFDRDRLNAAVKAAGGSIHWCLADITLESSLPQLRTSIESIHRPLGGIFHLAGSLNDKIINNVEWKDLEVVFQPKIAGLLHLDQLSQEYLPAYFVCFSSVAALFGAPGQANYAAANAFMDAFVLQRTKKGLPGLSINWGLWQGAGMAERAASHKAGNIEIIRKTTAAENFAALEMLLRSKLPQAAVFALNREACRRLPVTIPLVNVGTRKDPEESNMQPPAATAFTTAFFAAAPEQQEGMLMRAIRSAVNKTLGNAPDYPLDPDTGFASSGMDSIMAVELQQGLQKELQISFSVTALFNYNTLAALSDYLLAKMREDARCSTPPALQTPLVAENPFLMHQEGHEEAIPVDTLSDEEAISMLEEILARKNI